jgi:hypothetical protein
LTKASTRDSTAQLQEAAQSVCGLCVTLGTRTLVCGAEWAYTESERNLSGFLSRPDPESPKIRPFYRLRKPPPGRFYPDTIVLSPAAR